jgi:hypothetical protein
MVANSARVLPDSNRIAEAIIQPRVVWHLSIEPHGRLNRMPKPRLIFRIFTDSGPLIALAVAIAFLVGIVAPASAQFFNFGGLRPRSSWFGGDFFAPFQQQAPKRAREDFSRAPPPEKRETTPERNVLVLGDGMADWLAYGLEDAYTEQPDMGVVRRFKTFSGLIKYQPKGDPADWAAAARGILATEKPDAIVVMLGLNDRIALREPAAEKPDGKSSDKKKDGRAKTQDDKATDKAGDKTADKPSDKTADGKSATKPDGSADVAAKPDDRQIDTELPPDDTDNGDNPAGISPDRSPRSPNGVYEFRDDRWVELYSKKIEEMIAVLKAKGVPVLWVGLPAIRGPKGTADMLFLDQLYRDEAGKAGITYVDVWDGFVDDAGRFLQQGPDFEGQIRRLRSYDGVYFTKPGARKLAHYVEREIARLLAARTTPIELPTEPVTPDANALPGQPAPRPLAGPILPLVASSVGTDQLLGGSGSRPAAVDALALRTLVKGEPLAPPPGRADDFVWPRREVGHEQARGETPVASVTPDTALVATTPQSAKSKLKKPKTSVAPQPAATAPPTPALPALRDIFGFGPPQRATPTSGAPIPRPPGTIGRASVPDTGVLAR